METISADEEGFWHISLVMNVASFGCSTMPHPVPLGTALCPPLLRLDFPWIRSWRVGFGSVHLTYDGWSHSAPSERHLSSLAVYCCFFALQETDFWGGPVLDIFGSRQLLTSSHTMKCCVVLGMFLFTSCSSPALA